MMTKVSFIIVAYNAEKCLGALLDDLLAQTLAPRQLEVLLVDSASSDGTRQMMCDFSKRAPFSVKVLDNPKRWLASGINIALQAATGDAGKRLGSRDPRAGYLPFLRRSSALPQRRRGALCRYACLCALPP